MNILDKIAIKKATLADQEEALQDPLSAYWFALKITGANIEKCQEVVCQEPYYAYCFALDIKESNIEKCQEAACKSSEYAYYFVRRILGANIEMSIEACKGTEYEAKLNQYLMEKALL